jgi:hypothetical protein
MHQQTLQLHLSNVRIVRQGIGRCRVAPQHRCILLLALSLVEKRLDQRAERQPPHIYGRPML